MVSNLDNLAAGVALGMRDTRITATPNLIIATVTMAATAGAMVPGRALSQAIPPSVGAALGASIISVIGLCTVFTSVRPVRSLPSSPDLEIGRVRGRFYQSGRGKVVSSYGALGWVVALSINNAATGVGAGIAGVPPLATAVLAGALSLICVGGGSRVGLSLGRLLGGAPASLTSGLILLGVGAAVLAGAG